MKPNPIIRQRCAAASPSPAFLLLATSLLLFVAIQPAPASAQTSPTPRADAKVLVGTWTATFKGTTFMRLHFAEKAGKLTATLSNGQIALNSEGEISAVKVMPGVQKIKVGKFEGNTAYLRQGTKKKPLRFAFRLQDKTHAKLEILHPKPALFDSPAVVVAPKPILLVKQTTTKKP